MKDESTETSYLTNILCISYSAALSIPNVASVFTKFNPSREGELKRTEFDGAFCKNYRVSSFFR